MYQLTSTPANRDLTQNSTAMTALPNSPNTPVSPLSSSPCFSHLLPPDKEWYTPKEVAAIVGRTDQYVRDAFENQRILGHATVARAVRGREKRRSYQIHRSGVLLFLLESANYPPYELLDRLAEYLKRSSRQEREYFKQRLDYACRSG